MERIWQLMLGCPKDALQGHLTHCRHGSTFPSGVRKELASLHVKTLLTYAATSSPATSDGSRRMSIFVTKLRLYLIMYIVIQSWLSGLLQVKESLRPAFFSGMASFPMTPVVRDPLLSGRATNFRHPSLHPSAPVSIT
jgi:hypothetical protein